MRTDARIPDLVIRQGETASAPLAREAHRYADSFTIGCLAAALTGTVTVEISLDDGENYHGFQSPPGTDVAIAATKAITILAPAWTHIRVKSSSAEAIDRTFQVRISEEIGTI